VHRPGVVSPNSRTSRPCHGMVRSAQKSAPTNFVMKFAGELARVRFGRLFGGVGEGEGDGIVGGLKVCRRPAHPIIDIQP